MKTVANKSRDDLNSSAKRKRILCRGLVYLFAIVMAITAFYPFFVMIISSTHDNYNIVAKINVLPGTHLKENFERLTQNIELYKGIINSLLLAVTVTVVQNYFTKMCIRDRSIFLYLAGFGSIMAGKRSWRFPRRR